MCSYTTLEALGGDAGAAGGDDEDDVPPLDLSDARDQHLYPVEEEEEEEESVATRSSPALRVHATASTAPTMPAPLNSLAPHSASINDESNTNIENNIGDVPATAIAAPPNVIAPASFAPPAYGEGE